ncbi:MAG TPA: tRNA pseudouridine(55) synthase TruB [Polyangiaceae bacterium]|nr:tRNA pseudouridine(55) synthase TruB [Polyangiaceae bacterium]
MQRAALSGVAIVDKPRGMTSHAVVAQARKLFGRREIGHAGTLDPMATGVLVVLVGQACKLSSYLTADRKRYAAEIRFGIATDTLDADGQITLEAPIQPQQLAPAEVEAALAAEHARTRQVPPAVSAIKVSGQRAYALARRGQAPELAARSVEVHELKLVRLEPPLLRCELLVSKGYYVRALARDLGERLGAAAHLCSLRRLASGPFGLDQALVWPPREAPALLGLAEAATAALPVARLTADAVSRARQGKQLEARDFVDLPAGPAPTAWLSPHGELVAIGTAEPPFQVLRGFNPEAVSSP